MDDYWLIVIPAPDYVIKNNKVRCIFCGVALKTRRKYTHHWLRRHYQGGKPTLPIVVIVDSISA